MLLGEGWETIRWESFALGACKRVLRAALHPLPKARADGQQGV